ncbi:MAG: hypothetical protein QXR02_03380 [Acidilobaceae archaeon]
MIRKALQDKRGTPGQKSLKFIIQSINPDTIVLIANNIEKLEEYIEAIKIGDIDKETLEEIIRIHDTMMYENPELELNE